MDLAQKIPYFTLDVISHIGLGQPFGDLLADADVNDYIKSSEEGLRIGNTAWAMGFNWLRNAPFIGPAISPSEKDTAGFGKMMAEARKIVDARKMKSTEDKSDMLASFIRNGVEGDDLFQEVFEQILAGSDTTAGAIRIIMLYVITHPRVYKKLQREIDEAGKARKASVDGVVSDAEARKLPYLCAVVREGMRVSYHSSSLQTLISILSSAFHAISYLELNKRLTPYTQIHPPVCDIFSRISPPTPTTITISNTAYSIPANTLIGYSAWSMHRTNTTLYGADAPTFRPERWLTTDDPERLTQMKRTNDMVFGHGRWVCPGRQVALIEIHKVVFELFREFDFAVVEPRSPWKTGNCLGLWEISDFWVGVSMRE
jgi:cytochrome P450